MKLLLDECIPIKLKNHFQRHLCRSVSEEGWAGEKNGELLNKAENAGFQAFLTIDQGIEYQQNLRSRGIAIILIHSKSNRLADLLPHVPEILQNIDALQPGQLVKVGSSII